MIDRKQLEAKLGWLRDYRQTIDEWSQWHEVIQVLVRQARRHGIDRDSVAELRRQRAPCWMRDRYTEKALRLLRSPAVRQAFHLDEEDPRFRDHYGRTKQGQSVVLARRLIEAGVRFVTVHDGQYNGQLANWGAHADVFNRLKDVLHPPADLALAALIDDLAARGLLDTTLVIAMGEFGRTPRINGTAGRDHWPHC